jgi:type I restriction enzyme S subunit
VTTLSTLIQDLCPNGVRYFKLGELEDQGLLKLGRGDVISKMDLNASPGDFPVYSSSAVSNGLFGSYGKYMFDDERITWSIDGGGRFFYREAHQYSVTNVCGWLKVFDQQLVSTRYLYFVLISVWGGRTYNYTVKAHPSVIREDYLIPLPPIQVQNEIVAILDKFTELETALEDELRARKQQYEFFRHRLLKTSHETSKSYTLDEISTKISSGGTPSRSKPEYFGGTIPWVRTQEVDFNEIFGTDIKITDQALKNSSANWVPANTVILAMYGATAGKSAITRIPVTTNQACCNLEVDETLCLPDYLFHWLMANYLEIKSLGQGTQSNLNAGMVRNIEIDLPSLELQSRIVIALNNFDVLTKDENVGIPGEILVRRQQYEYYRNKLLTFNELERV